MHKTAHSLFCYLFQIFKVFFCRRTFLAFLFGVWAAYLLLCFPLVLLSGKLFCVGPSRLFCYRWWRTVLESKIRIATSTYLGLSNIGFHHIHKKSSDLWHLEIDMCEDHLLHRCNNSTKIYYCPEKVPKIVHEPPTERHSGKKKQKQ